MKILIACSKHFYDRIPEIKKELEILGHMPSMPNSYDNPFMEEEMKNIGVVEHASWKAEMLRKDEANLKPNEAILVLNFEKNGQPNYIGGATFLEINKAFELGKKIYLFNPIPDNIFKDEMMGYQPVVLNGDLSKLSPKNFEVEIRSFISGEKYDELLNYFKENGELVSEEFGEYHYYNSKVDLRTVKNDENSKIVLKGGKMHDDAREEIEINIDRDDFEKVNKIFDNLGYDVELKFFRKRFIFSWEGVSVSLGDTKGYGYIIELGKMGNNYEKEEILGLLREKLKILGIEETSKEEFNNKFAYYRDNWRELTK